MKSDRLQLFVSVAKHLSITQAAREHRISQPAVSRQLKLLQQELGFSLLKKKGRGIQLTQSGRALFEQGANMFSQFDAFKRTHGKQKQESLTLAGSHGPSTHLLPSLMTEFNQKHPLAWLNLLTGSRAEIGEWIMTSDVDLAVVSNRTTSPSLQMEPFRREKLVAFVAPNHPLARKKSLRTSEFGDIQLIVKIRRKGQSRTETQLSEFAKRGIKFKTVMRFESSQSVKEAVRHGVGVGILFHDTVNPDIEQGEFVAVRFAGLDVARQTYIAYSKVEPFSSLGREFLSLLRASATKNLSMETVSPPTSNKRRKSPTHDHSLRFKPRY